MNPFLFSLPDPSRLRRQVLATLGGIVVVLFGPSAFAQPNRPPPHIGFVYPAGAKIGQVVTVSIGGQNLTGATGVYVSGSAISATITGYDRPLTQKEFNDLREKLQSLQERRAAALGLPTPERPEAKQAKLGKKEAGAETTRPGTPLPNGPTATAPLPAAPAPKPTWTAADQKMLVDLRDQIATKRPNRQGNPAIAETLTLQVALAPDAPSGMYELRVETAAGLSNPMRFYAGELPEHTQPVVTATTLPATPRRREAGVRPTKPQAGDVSVTIPSVLNGQILPGEVDRYRFTARKGQHLTVAVSARTLIPYLADAVPGWFQATLALYDPKGRELAYSDSFRFSPDPVVSYEIPADGEYAIEIKDSIYRGREDFVYRIAIGELPFVTSVFPLGLGGRNAAAIAVSGWNLPASNMSLDPKERSTGTVLLSVRNRGVLSNSVQFALDGTPATRDQEPNNNAASAQRVSLPIVVDGRIDQAGDVDAFQFEGKAGSEIVAEVFARRLGSPLDSTLQLLDAAGRVLASNDDCEDKSVGLMTHHADSRLNLKLPADGTYTVRLADAQHQGGAEYAYRLRIGAPQPDFELRLVPSGVVVRPGAHVPVTVYALRRDGFTGPIDLIIKDPSRGFTLEGARIPAGQEKVQLTIGAPFSAREEIASLSVVGRATIADRTVDHDVVPADDMMQAFAYHHLVPASALLVDVVGRPGPAFRLLTRGPVQLTPNAPTIVSINCPTPRGATIIVELNDPPEGVSAKASESRNGVTDVAITCDAAKVKPGLVGNLIFNVFGERANPAQPKAAQRVQRFPLGSAAAVPFEVLAAAPPVAAQ